VTRSSRLCLSLRFTPVLVAYCSVTASSHAFLLILFFSARKVAVAMQLPTNAHLNICPDSFSKSVQGNEPWAAHGEMPAGIRHVLKGVDVMGGNGDADGLHGDEHRTTSMAIHNLFLTSGQIYERNARRCS